MKLAEALIERADLQKRVAQLQARIVANASYQEGEEPTEDAGELLDQCEGALDELERLVTRINVTNTATTASDGRSMTALLSAREALRQRHSILVAAADAATFNRSHRQLRSELRQLSALPVAQIRERADSVARELRQLDIAIQSTNWEADLI